MGMYDEIIFNCPKCSNSNTYQTNMADCNLKTYGLSDAPLIAIADLNDEGIKDRLYCEHCGVRLFADVRFTVGIRSANEMDGKFREV